MDLAAGLAALPALAAVAAILAAWLSVTSPGPLLFRQRRVGYRGRIFDLYKFRTMHAGAETGSHQAHVTALLRSNRPMQKLDGDADPRVVPGTWILRASGLDELPQVLNMLRGEMSLVGPRPCLPYEYTHYTAAQRRRCDVLPGLTGLWQVSGKNRTTFEAMIALDTEYSRRRSPGLDLRIIALTLPVLVGQVLETRRQRRRPAEPAGADGGASSPAAASRPAPAPTRHSDRRSSGPVRTPAPSSS
jgi:lipopolysaccharide/colanic/teichoic acid biosynthesis glycosyltransferase